MRLDLASGMILNMPEAVKYLYLFPHLEGYFEYVEEQCPDKFKVLYGVISEGLMLQVRHNQKVYTVTSCADTDLTQWTLLGQLWKDLGDKENFSSLDSEGEGFTCPYEMMWANIALAITKEGS